MQAVDVGDRGVSTTSYTRSSGPIKTEPCSDLPKHSTQHDDDDDERTSERRATTTSDDDDDDDDRKLNLSSTSSAESDEVRVCAVKCDVYVLRLQEQKVTTVAGSYG